ncbi:MAG TPA: hypothetical protein GYA04_01975, partial [Acholeplasma sp.]|nr:hypothetical protein [Acholeplasma sp.]
MALKFPYLKEQIAKDNKTPLLTQTAPVFSLGTGKDEQGQELDLSSNVTHGQISVTAKGLTATNLVQNGDFRNG